MSSFNVVKQNNNYTSFSFFIMSKNFEYTCSIPVFIFRNIFSPIRYATLVFCYLTFLNIVFIYKKQKLLNLLLVCNACINVKAIICKSSLLNDNKALENDAIAF